jgi:hypothetical protein
VLNGSQQTHADVIAVGESRHERGQPGQIRANCANANTRHGLARQGAHPHSILRISQTIDESM